MIVKFNTTEEYLKATREVLKELFPELPDKYIEQGVRVAELSCIMEDRRNASIRNNA